MPDREDPVALARVEEPQAPPARQVPVPRAKLRVPITTDHPVRRERLLTALDSYTTDRRTPSPVTIVCGPPGAGKTTLLATWAARQTSATGAFRIAWVTLDEHDNDPSHLWSAIREALLLTGAWDRDDQLGALQPPGDDVRLDFPAALTAAFDDVSTPVCLILDSAQELHRPAVLRSIETVVRHTPDNLRLVVAGRTPPKLHLSRLRVEGRLREIGGSELAFTADEAEALLVNHGVRLAPADMGLLHERTEGWAVGLRLAAMSLAEQPDLIAMGTDFPANARSVADYLVEEVLDQQPDHIRRFLLSTSVCGSVNAELAVAMSQQENSGEILDRLERTNSLLVKLDRPGGWYRYHPILRDYLRAELARKQPGMRRHLHHAAAQWHREAGDALAALEHGIAVEHSELAGELIESFGLREILEGNAAQLYEMLKTVPDNVLARPLVALVTAAAALDTGDLPAVDRSLLRIDNSAQPLRTDRLRTLHAAVALHRSRFDGDPVRTLKAMSTTPVGDTGDVDIDLLALYNRSVAELWHGQHESAEDDLRRALELATRGQRDYAALQCRVHLAAVACARGEFARMDELATSAVEFARVRGWARNPCCTLAYVLLGLQAYQRLDHERAQSLAELAIGLRPARTHPTAALAAHCLHAIVAFDAAQDPHAVVRSMRDRWRRVVDGRVARSLIAYVAPTAQRMALQVGEQGWAVEIAEQVEAVLGDCGELDLLQAVLHSHRARTTAARKLLRPVLHGEVQSVVANTVIDAWLLEAVLVERAGDQHRAHEAITRALERAEPVSAIRPFLNAGRPVRDLMVEGAGRFGRLDRFASTALAALPAPSAASVDPLTGRESELLVELPSMRTTEEIADSMYVSVNTVKTHLRGIYRKLGVNQRRDAVTVARQRGLL